MSKELSSNKRYLTWNTFNGSVQVIVARNYWKALSKAQKWFGSNTGIRVKRDTFSTISGVR